MLDIKQFLIAVKQISEEKGIAEESVLETVEAAIAAAYKRDYGKKGQIIKAKLDPETGNIKMSQIRYVVEGVDEEGNITGQLPTKLIEEKPDFMERTFVSLPANQGNKSKLQENNLITSDADVNKIKFNPEKHILLEDAKKIDKNIKAGDELITELETHTDFGRIAAQTAKQVIIQKLREAERGAIYKEFKEKEGEIISGIIQRKEGSLVFVDLGKTNGLLPVAEQVRGENYKIGSRLRFLILKVEENPKGPVILLSRSHPKLVYGLFRMEVPEIDSGLVEVKAIAREAGSRTKIAVTSKEEGVDPIGSLVGQKGVRVQTVINELGGEKIDIITWSSNIEEFIANSFSPAKVLNVKIINKDKKHALVEVSEDQFSLAIGKQGQNVRLAANLTDWKIDVRSSRENVKFAELESEASNTDDLETPTAETSTTDSE
jgi:N utilization substance protein A